jgi:hypothetical protein
MTLQLIDALLPGYGESLHHPQTSLRCIPLPPGVTTSGAKTIRACMWTHSRRARSRVIVFCASFAIFIPAANREPADGSISIPSRHAFCRG